MRARTRTPSIYLLQTRAPSRVLSRAYAFTLSRSLARSIAFSLAFFPPNPLFFSPLNLVNHNHTLSQKSAAANAKKKQRKLECTSRAHIPTIPPLPGPCCVMCHASKILYRSLFWISGCAASGGALAPEPPRATRNRRESIGTFGENTLLFRFFRFSLLFRFFRKKKEGKGKTDLKKNRIEPNHLNQILNFVNK